MPREYMIYIELPCYPEGGQRFGAFPSRGKPWRELCDSLPTDVACYGRFDAPNKREAVAEAKRRWDHV